MWLDRAQMLLAAVGVALGVVMVAFGVIAASGTGVLLIVVGVVVLGNGVWFFVDATRRMKRFRDEKRRSGTVRP